MTNKNKEKIKKLRDEGLTYYEISQELGISQDAIRNFFYRERLRSKTDDDARDTALRILQKQINKLQREKNKLLARQAIDETLADLIDVPIYIPKFEPLADAREEAILNLSDIHFGMLYKGTSNIYTPEIAALRLNRIISYTNEILKKYYPHVHKLHIFMLGDMVDGYGIFKGQEYSSIPITDQISQFPSILASSLTELEIPFDVYAVDGNHGRMAKGVPQHNWDNVIYHLTKKMLPDIKFTIAKDYYLPVTIKNTNFILLHGDGITRSKRPSSFIERSIGEFAIMFKGMDIKFDYLTLGHFHTPYMLPNAIVNGSLCGDTYITTKNIRTTSKPVQGLFFVDEKYGLTTGRWIYAQI